MSTTKDTIDSQVAAYLTNAGVAFTIEGGTPTVRDDDWRCFAWRATLGGQSFDYFTGVGLVKKVPRALQSYSRGPVPLRPTSADVLQSLLLESSAGDQSFESWCDEYGYNNDSLKAFDSYRACCASALKLRKVFSAQQLAELRDLTQDL